MKPQHVRGAIGSLLIIAAAVTAGIVVSADQWWWLIAAGASFATGWAIVIADYDFMDFEAWTFMALALSLGLVVVLIASFATREARHNDVRNDHRMTICMTHGGSWLRSQCVQPNVKVGDA